MKQYVVPEVEFVEFESIDVLVTSEPCINYECPDSYGNICTGLPYIGS